MGDTVREQLRGRGVYLAFTGGCAALAASRMTLKGVYYEDLGMPEAIWAIECTELPLTVAIDAKGNDLFRDVRLASEKLFAEMF
jgi:fumarate hydratase subunit beta